MLLGGVAAMGQDPVSGVLGWEAKDAAAMERRLGANPADETTRLQVLAYYSRGDQMARPDSRKRRADLIAWLIEHEPGSAIFARGYAMPDRPDPAVDRLWDDALRSHMNDPRAFGNAALFYGQIDPRRHALYAEKSFTLDPDNTANARQLGEVYALCLLRVNPEADPDGSVAARGLKVLETTTSAPLVEVAVQVLRSQQIKSMLMTGRPDAAADALGARLIARVRALDPNAPIGLIYPDMPPAPAPPPQTSSDYRRLTPDEIPGLPVAIRAALNTAGCTIPQAVQSGPPQGVERGAFMERGVVSWAVLCARQGRSSILVFHDSASRRFEEVAREPVEGRIADGILQRSLGKASARFIQEHYRAYGGPKPPPLDHIGIDDEIPEKASTVWYRYRGKWSTYSGAD